MKNMIIWYVFILVPLPSVVTIPYSVFPNGSNPGDNICPYVQFLFRTVSHAPGLLFKQWYLIQLRGRDCPIRYDFRAFWKSGQQRRLRIVFLHSAAQSFRAGYGITVGAAVSAGIIGTDVDTSPIDWHSVDSESLHIQLSTGSETIPNNSMVCPSACWHW